MSKIKEAQRQEIMYLYRSEGWRPMHIARKYGISHQLVSYHVSGIAREVQALDHCPKEVVQESAHVQSWRRNRPAEFKTYEDYLADDEHRRRKKRDTCGHEKLAIICLCCGQHFEETKNQEAKARVIFM